MAGWQSGHAAACKAVYAGSIPASACIMFAWVAKLVDARDLKSLGIVFRAGSTPAPGTIFVVTMKKSISLLIGSRYIRAKCKNRYVSFLSLFSIIATSLGITVLMTVMSVMNGFDHEIKQLVFTNDDHLVVADSFGNIKDWEKLSTKLKSYSNVVSVEPSVEVQALINNNDELLPALLKGAQHSNIAKTHPKLATTKYGIVLTQNYAYRANVDIGDDILVITPKIIHTMAGARPQMHKFKVVEISPNTKFAANQIVRMEDLQKLLAIGDAVSYVNIKMDNLASAPKLQNQLRNDPNFFYSVSSWAERYGQLFKALKLQKTMMFLILMLIIIIAAFNMLSSMVMLVADKRSSIAVLRSLGLTKQKVIYIFIIQGVIIGVIGMIAGTICGYILSTNVTSVVHALEALIGYKLVDKSVYMLDYLPSHIDWNDVIFINITAFILSVLATLYPSYKASLIKPAKVLRGEG